MTKRRLTNQQQSRIAQKQQRELVANESDSGVAESKAASSCNGRIISHYGQQLEVESLDPAQDGKTVRCFQRANLPSLVTGDLVQWEAGEADTGVILAVAKRNSLFGRPTGLGKFKPVAANIDCVLVVIAPLPEPFMNLIDRYLVAIEALGLPAKLVLNKADMLNAAGTTSLDKMLSLYEKIGYELHRVSALGGKGIDELLLSLKGQTTVLVGQSGVGKSSLINRFGRSEVATVGPLSDGKYKGTHTTTTSTLFHLPYCDLIDSPGIREFGLGHVTRQQVFDGFREFAAITEQCKFRDCSHQSEPGCAIQSAVKTGAISAERLGSFFQIIQSIEHPTY